MIRSVTWRTHNTNGGGAVSTNARPSVWECCGLGLKIDAICRELFVDTVLSYLKTIFGVSGSELSSLPKCPRYLTRLLPE